MSDLIERDVKVKQSVYIGDIFTNGEGCSYVVIDYKNSQEATVKFDDVSGFETTTNVSNIKKGSIKNPFYPSVYGIGFIGVGRHKSKVDGRNTLAYSTWIGMFIRCYRKNIKQSDISYIGCLVAPEWHNFQNFADWYEGHDSYGLSYHLDKDLLKKGNRVYSPELCCLIPPELNAAIVNPAPSSTGLPVGVNLCKRSGRFRVRVNEKGVSRYIGRFDSVDAARAAYVEAKECHIKALAKDWQSRVAENVYNSLISWSALDD